MDDAIELFMVGPIQTNCYAYESAGECMVVDPGGEGAMLADALSGFKVVAIVCTHGHGLSTTMARELAVNPYLR